MDDQASTRIASALERASETAIATLDEVMHMQGGLDEEQARLVRSKVTAATTTLNTQTRVDAMRMRAMRVDRALERLVSLVRAKAESVPNAMGSLVTNNHSQQELSGDAV